MTTGFDPDEFLQNVHIQGVIKRLDQLEESIRTLVEGLKAHETQQNELESSIDAKLETFKDSLIFN